MFTDRIETISQPWKTILLVVHRDPVYDLGRVRDYVPGRDSVLYKGPLCTSIPDELKIRNFYSVKKRIQSFNDTLLKTF